MKKQAAPLVSIAPFSWDKPKLFFIFVTFNYKIYRVKAM